MHQLLKAIDRIEGDAQFHDWTPGRILMEVREAIKAALGEQAQPELTGAERVALHNVGAKPASYAPPYPDAAVDPFNAVMAEAVRVPAADLEPVLTPANAPRYIEMATDPDAEAIAYAARMGDRWEHMGEEAREAVRAHVRRLREPWVPVATLPPGMKAWHCDLCGFDVNGEQVRELGPYSFMHAGCGGSVAALPF